MTERQIGGVGFIAGRWPLDTEKSTIVFIHGSGGTGRLWLAQVKDLAERVNTVALDLPGRGRSFAHPVCSCPSRSRHSCARPMRSSSVTMTVWVAAVASPMDSISLAIASSTASRTKPSSSDW